VAAGIYRPCGVEDRTIVAGRLKQSADYRSFTKFSICEVPRIKAGFPLMVKDLIEIHRQNYKQMYLKSASFIP
jgi:hypothetical protein